MLTVSRWLRLTAFAVFRCSAIELLPRLRGVVPPPPLDFCAQLVLPIIPANELMRIAVVSHFMSTAVVPNNPPGAFVLLPLLSQLSALRASFGDFPSSPQFATAAALID